MTPFEQSALLLSLWVAVWALALILPPGIALGWLLARKRFPGRAALEGILYLPLVLPPVVTGYLLLLLFGRTGPIGGPLHRLFGVEILFTTPAMILAAAAVGLPLLVRSVRTSMEGVDPGLVDAARTLGYSQWRAFFAITLPLSRAGLLAGAVLAFARGLGEFGATVMVSANVPGSRTLALEIYRLSAEPGGEAAVLRLAVLSVLLSFAAILLGERWAGRARSGR